MKWENIAVRAGMGLEEGLPCICCKKLETDILYYPTHLSGEQEQTIEKIWGPVDIDSEFLVCEECMDGHCGTAPWRTPDDWFVTRLKEYEGTPKLL
jgi:hypothetical protein